MLVGTGLRELRSAELWWRDGAPFGVERLHFGTALRERFGTADTHTFSNACSASLYTLALGADMLALGEADTVIVAGVDSITESMFGLADRVQPEPPPRCGPWTSTARARSSATGPPPSSCAARTSSRAAGCGAGCAGSG